MAKRYKHLLRILKVALTGLPTVPPLVDLGEDDDVLLVVVAGHDAAEAVGLAAVVDEARHGAHARGVDDQVLVDAEHVAGPVAALLLGVDLLAAVRHQVADQLAHVLHHGLAGGDVVLDEEAEAVNGGVAHLQPLARVQGIQVAVLGGRSLPVVGAAPARAQLLRLVPVHAEGVLAHEVDDGADLMGHLRGLAPVLPQALAVAVADHRLQLVGPLAEGLADERRVEEPRVEEGQAARDHGSAEAHAYFLDHVVQAQPEEVGA
ncbi:HK97 family phage prohead protease [Babesia caballi]|uniref:HK97 family phage prohead protease n=1 Tax=Babesia caballi TaxID=5871 RepID=A0AAV4LRU7_BABCB|nr:HK97 family phage prohead protease [Babesia caballi]